MSVLLLHEVHPKEAEVRQLAGKGYGHEDIRVKLGMSWRDYTWVRNIVMSTRAEYRGWQR